MFKPITVTFEEVEWGKQIEKSREKWREMVEEVGKLFNYNHEYYNMVYTEYSCVNEEKTDILLKCDYTFQFMDRDDLVFFINTETYKWLYAHCKQADLKAILKK